MNKQITTLLVLFALISYGQSGVIDSLKHILQKNCPDTQKVKIFEKLSFYSARQDIKISLLYRDSCEIVAKKIDQKRFYAYSERANACLFFNKSFYRKAINHYFKSNELLDKSDPITKAANFSAIGYCYHRLSQTDSFYFYSITAIKIFQSLKRDDKLAEAYGNMAYVLTGIDKIKEAKEYYKLSNDIASKLKDTVTLYKNYQNIGILYENIGKYDSALYFFQEGLNLKLKSRDTLSLSTSYNGIANIYLRKKNFEMFLKNMLISVFYAKKTENIGAEATGYYFIGEGYYTIDKIDSCIQYMNQALLLYKSIEYNSQVSDCYMYMAECYGIKKEFEKAFEAHKLHKTYYDKVVNTESSAQLENLKIGYETEKKDQENQFLQSQNQLSEKTIQKQQLTAYFIVGGLVMVSFLAFFIFNGLKKQRRANVIISKQKEEVHQQKEIIEEHQKETIDSINYAKRIQYALLGNKDLLQKNLPEHFIFFRPKDIVSGDFYWATEHDNKFYLAVCDSTGHGVPGAFMSLLNMGFLSEPIKEKNISQPHEVLNYVRKRLIESIGNDGQQDGMDAILICIDKSQIDQKITYAAANNEPVLIRNNKIIILPKDKMPVGKGERKYTFTLQTIDLQDNDVLYLYTDGYADQFGGSKGKKYKYKPLNDLLLANSTKQMNDQSTLLIKEFDNWKDDLEQVDDVCVVGIKF